MIHELNKRLPPGENKIFASFGRAELFNNIFGDKFISHKGLTLENLIHRDFPAIDMDKLKRILVAGSTADLAEADETILYSLLNSSLDARVIDFVRRDSLHLGLSSGDSFEIDDLLPHLIISPGVVGKNVSRVSLKTSGITVAEQIILMRYWLFQRVYWNQPNRSYWPMLMFGVLTSRFRKNGNLSDWFFVYALRAAHLPSSATE